MDHRFAAVERPRTPEFPSDPARAAVSVAAPWKVLLPRTALVTPNLAEAAKLTESDPRGSLTIRDFAQAILETGCRVVLVKGGHAAGPEASDLPFDAATAEEFSLPRIPGPTPHGTGCALSAAIAARLAHRDPGPREHPSARGVSDRVDIFMRP